MNPNTNHNDITGIGMGIGILPFSIKGRIPPIPVFKYRYSNKSKCGIVKNNTGILTGIHLRVTPVFNTDKYRYSFYTDHKNTGNDKKGTGVPIPVFKYR